MDSTRSERVASPPRGQRLRRSDAITTLADFAIVTFDVDPVRLSTLLPPGFEPEVRHAAGRPRARVRLGGLVPGRRLPIRRLPVRPVHVPADELPGVRIARRRASRVVLRDDARIDVRRRAQSAVEAAVASRTHPPRGVVGRRAVPVLPTRDRGSLGSGHGRARRRRTARGEPGSPRRVHRPGRRIARPDASAHWLLLPA